MKKQIMHVLMISLFSVVPLYPFMDLMMTGELMDQLFAEMMERTRAQKIEAPDYDVTIKRNNDVIEISLGLPAYVTSRDISVQTEDDTLYVVIAAQSDRVELKIKDRVLVITAVTTITREAKDDQGTTYHVSSGSAHMAQTLQLPARIDVHTTRPIADLSNGVLTITVGVKGVLKIPVTTSGESVRCGDGACNCGDRPINPIDNEIHREVGCDVGRDVFRENFEK